MIFSCIGPVHVVSCAFIRDPNGQIAQLVEQRIENPRVPGSIPGLATTFFYRFPAKNKEKRPNTDFLTKLANLLNVPENAGKHRFLATVLATILGLTQSLGMFIFS